MAADPTAHNAVLKEVWHPDRLEEQLYVEHPTLDKLERQFPDAEHGDKVVTAVHTQRAGGYSAVPRTGSQSLNPATEQTVNQAEWTQTYHWKQIAVESSVIRETSSNAKAVASSVKIEVEGALENLRRQISRQIFSNGDALIAECATTAASNTVNLAPAGYGYDAIVRGWLHDDLRVDIGTAANEVSAAADRDIVSVNETAADPEMVISGAAVTTAAADFVSISNARSGATSNEMNGFRNMFGSTTASLGGINPATVTTWKPPFVDNTTTQLSFSKVLDGRRPIKQKTGKLPDWILTSLKQHDVLYKQVQPQVRFAQDRGTEAGNAESFTWAGMQVDSVPDCVDRDLYMLSKKALFLVRSDKPQWAPEEFEGRGSGILRWQQGTTRFLSALIYFVNLATTRRNTGGAFTALTA